MNIAIMVPLPSQSGHVTSPTLEQFVVADLPVMIFLVVKLTCGKTAKQKRYPDLLSRKVFPLPLWSFRGAMLEFPLYRFSDRLIRPGRPTVSFRWCLLPIGDGNKMSKHSPKHLRQPQMWHGEITKPCNGAASVSIGVVMFFFRRPLTADILLT